MSEQRGGLVTAKTALLATAGIGIICMVLRHRTRLWAHLRGLRQPLGPKHIQIVETAEECQHVVNTLKQHCNNHRVLGFDCEWVTVGGTRRPVALLQLASQQGLCALFCLCSLRQLPKSLRELLEDEKIIKIGVAPHDDAHKLAYDYGVGVASTLDLRFLAFIVGEKPEGLAKMAKNLLNVHLDKNWRLACSDWEAKPLNEKQLEYAANDALVAVRIYEHLIKKMEPRYDEFYRKFFELSYPNFDDIYLHLEPFLDRRFKDGILQRISEQKKSSAGGGKQSSNSKQQKRGLSTRSKTLYDNCLLQAPDGELLCTIDAKKAQWYLDQQLGDKVDDFPFTVRLNFEPAGRAVGDVGRYYQTPKENQCVVCGRRDAYIRKNVVPREYRKHFPVVMKSHTSHDVLLLCPDCHQLSNIFDLRVRQELAERCEAPFAHEEGAIKYFEVPELRNLKSAARALLLNSAQIPEARRAHLRQVVLDYYGERELTEEMLHEAANVDTTKSNENYCQHGERVVRKYETELGGLLELEKLWREHFLQSMKPKFLPALWNVNHNANRLEIRAQEGRIEEQDLLIAGLEAKIGHGENERKVELHKGVENQTIKEQQHTIEGPKPAGS